MKNFFKNIIALTIFGIAIFVFRDSLFKNYTILQDKYFPCTRTISYSLGVVDAQFGISKEEFLSAIKEGEDMWEISVNKDLFVYKSEDGELTINLIYDKRQATTEQLKTIDKTLENNQITYDKLKNEIDILKMNSNPDINKINILTIELNKFASSFNNQIKDYNNVGNSLGEEFEEGIYQTNENGKKIEIYQFENKEKLARVLMHELGHALELEHIDNTEAVMYRLNIGTNLTPTKDDINALKNRCGLVTK